MHKQPQTQSHADAAREFLLSRFGNAPSHLFALLWRKKGKESRWLPIGTLGGLDLSDLCEPGAGDVYVGVGLSPEDFGHGKRCEAAAVAGIAGLWLDIDLQDKAHKADNLPQTIGDARELAYSLGAPPTEMVHSGYGVHAYWLFPAAWVFATDAERAKAANLSERFQAAFRRNAAALGWKLDSTHDLARILRLPGTWNCKTRPPVLACLLDSGGPRYDREDLAALLEEQPATATPDTHKDNGTASHYTTNGCNVAERARRYVAKMPAAIAGENGHDATFAVAQVLVRGFDLPESEAWPILLDYNRRCKPEWSEAELRHKLEQASAKSRLPRGYLLGRNGSPSPSATGSTVTENQVHLSDLGNARRVVQRHGHDLRYCHPWKTWHVWDGRRWAEDTTAEAVRRVKETQGAFYRWAAEKVKQLGDVGDDVERKEQLARLEVVLKHALRWEDARRIGACLDLARSEPGIPVLPEHFDTHPFQLNVANGTLDLRTGKLHPHRREDLLSKLAPVGYDPVAKCPLWEKCLDRIMGGNGGLVDYLQRVVGYCLTGDVSEQCLWFCHGTGANGKSTFLLTLMAMLGDYAMQAVSELLMVKNHEAHPTERADLMGKRFVATIETEQGKRLAESLMKQMTGGDKVRARRMRQDFFEFTPTHKLLLAANHRPIICGTDHAVWRRIKLVPFEVTIPEEEKDKELPSKLRAELPGILAWAVRGCLEWQANGLGEPEEVRTATAAYQAEQDVIQGFLDDYCILLRDAKIKASVLYTAYVNWSGDKLMSQRAFGDRLREKGFENRRSSTGYFWHGIGLPATGACEPSEPDPEM